MPQDPKTGDDAPKVAEHADETNRDEGKAEPGAHLTRRQDRNAEQTERSQGGGTGGTAHSDKPDRSNP